MLSETRRVYGSGALKFSGRGRGGGEVVDEVGDEVGVLEQEDQINDREDDANHAGDDPGGGHSFAFLPAV